MTRPALLLDSASIGDAARAARLGYVGGVTTNPALMAREGTHPTVQLASLLDVAPGLVFFQPISSRIAAAREEALTACALDSSRVVLKLPATRQFAGLARELSGRGVACALTGLYAAAQALVADQVGCGWVIAYFDRARRQGDGGEAVVGGIARVLERVDSDVRVIAASIKSGDQAIAAVMAGAHAITAPIGVLEELAEHQLTRDAVAGFDEAVAGAGLPAGAPDRGV